MSVSAFRANDTPDGKALLSGWSYDRTLILCVEGKTAGMTAGAFYPVQFKIFYYRIVKLLSKCIEILDWYC